MRVSGQTSRSARFPETGTFQRANPEQKVRACSIPILPPELSLPWGPEVSVKKRGSLLIHRNCKPENNAMKYVIIRSLFAFAALSLLFINGCRPLEEKEKGVADGLPVDCTYAMPSLPEVNRMLLQEPSNAQLYRIRSQILLDSSRYPEALSDAKRALSLNPEDAFNFVVVAKAHRALGHLDSALSACHTAEQSGFNDADNNLLLGDLYYIIRKYGKSLEYLNKALKQAPFEPRIYFLKGLVFWEQGDSAKAVSNWQTSIEQDAAYADGYIRLARYYVESGDTKTAEEYLRSGLRLRPGDAFLNANMGLFLSRSFPDSAITFFRTALVSDAGQKEALSGLGALLYTKGNWKEALPVLEQAARSDPKNPSVRYYLGLALRNDGQPDRAMSELKVTLELNKTFLKEAAAALEKVRKQRDKQLKDSLKASQP
jgi:tetratricopeptide (TPR) repeat protein